jgi:hypothetical protein
VEILTLREVCVELRRRHCRKYYNGDESDESSPSVCRKKAEDQDVLLSTFQQRCMF